MQRGGVVYIMASAYKGMLYVGVTSDLYGRVWKHKSKHYPDSFTARYNCVLLVYYKNFDRIEDAIQEEKRIKGGSRIKKEQLITEMNSEWKDLWDTLHV